MESLNLYSVFAIIVEACDYHPPYPKWMFLKHMVTIAAII